MESEEVNSENLPVEMYFKNIEEIIKEEKLDSEEEKEVQIKKEPAEINPIEFCDINMDTEEEENEYEEEMKESLEKNSSLCKVDLIDMQSQRDGEYCFILNYQDHLTKMVCLRALKTKTAEEVAYHLVDIFCDKGAPHILQSANGREFANKSRTANGNADNLNCEQSYSWNKEQSSSYHNNANYDPKKMVKCNECNNLFTKNYFKVHILNHSKEIFKCSQCNYTTNRKERLKLHELNHLETKTFKCGECSYATNIQKYFKEHVKIHLDKKVFNCSKCDYQTNIKKYLREHIMIHTEKKLFKCSKCYYETNRKDRLRIHEQNHSELKRFQCGHCDFGTNIKRVLKDHELTHLEATMFHCAQCEYTTNFKSSLTRHTHSHFKKK